MHSHLIHFNYNTKNNVNIGDEAHVLSIQKSIKKHLPRYEIMDIPIDYLCWNQYPVNFPLYRTNNDTIQRIGRVLRGTSQRKLVKIINNSSGIIIGGGGFYMNHLLPFDNVLIDKINVPIVIIGVGYNSNFGSSSFSQDQLDSIIKIGKKAQLQGVRDDLTKRFLSNLNIDSTMIGDPAIFLNHDKNMQIPIKQNNINVAVNIAAHGWRQQGIYKDKIINTYSNTLLHLEKIYKSQISFFYFVHHPGEIEVVHKLEAAGIKFSKIIHENASNTYIKYNDMDMAISMMLHSTILAFANAVPSVCIGYDTKNKEFMKYTLQEKQYIPASDLNTNHLIERVQYVLNNKDAIKIRIDKQKMKLQYDYDIFWGKIANIYD